MIRIAPEGWPFVLPGLAVTVLLGLGAGLSPVDQGPLPPILLGGTVFFGLLTAFIVFFFRNPRRVRRDGDGLVLAPADGRIVEIAEGEPNEFFAGPATRVSIFLSIFNVHVQRAPITGRIGLKVYKPGGFAVAWKPKASEENEQATLEIVAGGHRVFVKQIAGLVARRIVTDPEEGDLVPQGSRIGLIRFGSRVDLMVPEGWDLTCRKGDRVKAGLTALARTPKDADGGRV